MFPLPVRSSRATDRRSARLATGLAVAATVALALAAIGAGATAGPTAAGDSTDPAAPAAADAQTAPTLTIGDASTAPEEAETVAVELSGAPDGLAGYQITLELANPALARFANASYPDAYEPTTDPSISADGARITLEAMDLRDEVTAGEDEVRLATVEIRGEAAGETEITTVQYQLDADGGAPIDPDEIDSGTVAVGDVEGGAAATRAGGNGTGADSGSAATDAQAPEEQAATAPAASSVAAALGSWTVVLLVIVVGVVSAVAWAGRPEA